jgi:hypothetical protein
MIGQTVDAGDHFKKRAAIPLAPCNLPALYHLIVLRPKVTTRLLGSDVRQ